MPIWYAFINMRKFRFFLSVLLEVLPIFTFVTVTELLGFIDGVIWLIVATFISLIVSFATEKRVPYFGLFASLTILLFGALTIIFENPFFIIFKDTLYYFFFAFIILVGLSFKRSVLKFFFKDFLAITNHGWKVLSVRWFWFFVLLGSLNEVVRIYLSYDAWAHYKLFAVITIWIFGFYQVKVTKRERLPVSTKWGIKIGE